MGSDSDVPEFVRIKKNEIKNFLAKVRPQHSVKEIYTALNLSKQQWDNVRSGRRLLDRERTVALQELLEETPYEQWADAEQPKPGKSRFRPGTDITGPVQALTPYLLREVTGAGAPLVLYVSVKNGLWLEGFLESLPRADALDTRLVNTRIERIVVYLMSDSVADCLLHHNLVEEGLLERAKQHIERIKGYSRLIPDKSSSTPKRKAITVECRTWPRLPPIWAALAGNVMLTGEWKVNLGGCIEPAQDAALYRRGQTGGRFDEYAKLLLDGASAVA